MAELVRCKEVRNSRAFSGEDYARVQIPVCIAANVRRHVVLV